MCANAGSGFSKVCGDVTPQSDDLICSGEGTTMFMSGVKVMTISTDPCVVYLFDGWLLDTKGKLAASFIGTVVAGVVLGFAGLLIRMHGERAPCSKASVSFFPLSYFQQFNRFPNRVKP